MPRRNTHKPGDYLMKCDLSGFVYYASDMREQWNGLWVHKSKYEERHPQEFVRAQNDPEALTEIRPAPVIPAAVSAAGFFVGQTNVRIKPGPADHLFPTGIGVMVVGTTAPSQFVVS